MSRSDLDTPLTDAQRDLAAAHEPVARSLARTACRRWPRLADELESVAFLTLATAARDFDPARGPTFAAYLTQEIRYAFLDAYRWRSGFWERRTDAAVTPADLGLIVGSDPAPGAGMESAEHFDLLVGLAPARHAAMLRLRYGAGLTLVAAGAAVGLAKSSARHIEQDGLALIRRRLALRG